MLRKKIQKNLEQASMQNRVMVAKSIIGLFGNKIGTASMHTSDEKSQQVLIKSNTYRSNGASQN